jgi:hypothetical protein
MSRAGWTLEEALRMQYRYHGRTRFFACLLLIAVSALFQVQPAQASWPRFKFPAGWYENQNAQNWSQAYGCTSNGPYPPDSRFLCDSPNYVHEGVDIPFPNTYPTYPYNCASSYYVYAGMSGTVYTGNDPNGFGSHYPILYTDLDQKYVVIGHTASVLVPQGTRVSAGTAIAIVGNDGNSGACHVHFEVDANGCPYPTCNPPYGSPTTSIQPYAYMNGFISSRNDVWSASIGRSIRLASPGGTAYLGPTTVYPTNGQYTWTDVISASQDNNFDYIGRSILQNPMYIAYDPQGYTWTSTISWVCCTGNFYNHQTKLCANSNGTGCAVLANPQSVNFTLPANFYWQGQLALQPNSPPCGTCQGPTARPQ